MNNFKLEEFNCPCCGHNKMTQEFQDMIDEARRIAVVPFHINSGYRCEKHNKEVGSKSVNHTSGQAADIRCTDGQSRFKIIHALMRAGFKRIGIAKTFIHADCVKDSPTSIWFY
jgi:uncharacterized protein YcbK (DUF882 family)